MNKKHQLTHPQHRRNRLRFHLPSPPSHLSRLALREQRVLSRLRRRRRRETIPLTARQPNIPCDHLHRLNLHPRLGVMAAHGLRSSFNHRTRPGQRQRTKRRRHNSHGTGLVRLLAADYRHDRAFGNDIEYQSPV
jgi:hypothetical protein